MHDPTWTCSVAAARAAIGIVADRLYSSPVQIAPKLASSAWTARSAARRKRSGPRPLAAKTVSPYTNAPPLGRLLTGSPEMRRPFLYESGDAFLAFISGEQGLHLLGLVGGVYGADHRLLGRQGGPAQLRGQVGGFRLGLPGRCESAEEPDAESFIGADLAAGEHDVQGVAAAHQPRQPLGTACAGDEPEPDFGQPETGLGSGDP